MSYLVELPLLRLSALVLFGLAVYCWRFRDAPAVLPSMIAMSLAGAWAIVYVQDGASIGLADKIFWTELRFSITGALPLALLIAAMRHTGRMKSLSWWWIALLLVVPVITACLSQTSESHTLFHHNYRLDSAGQFPVLLFDSGSWYWAQAAFSFCLLAAALATLARSLWDTQPLYRRQTLAIIGAVLLFVTGLWPFNTGVTIGYNLSVWTFGLMVSIIAWSLFRYRMFDIVPVAWSTVLDGMGDLVLVLDNRDRIVDLNDAALRAIGAKASKAIGQPVGSVLSQWGGLVDRYRSVWSARDQIFVGDAGRKRSYDLSISPVLSDRGIVLGRLVAMRDAAERKRAEEQMFQRQQTWAVLDERERLEREIAERLHSSVQSRLLVVCLQLQKCEDLEENEISKARGILAKARDFIEDIVETDIKWASYRLHPSNIDEGLVPAVRSLTGEFSDYFPVELRVDEMLAEPNGPVERRLSAPLRLAAYRIVEEALNNVYRHAGARSVEVSLEIKEEGRLVIGVHDDGRGFDTGAVKHGLGLGSIAGRVEQVGGRWQITSTPGGGTTLSACFPLDSE